MSTPSPSAPNMRPIYWIIAVAVVALAIFGVVAYDQAQDDEEARAKAQQLTQKLQQGGLVVPDQDTIVASLGNDGGAVCENPANALGKAILADQLTNGASHVGRRPVIADSRFVEGELLILQTYCPEEAQEFKDEVVDALKFDDTVED